MKSIPLSIPDNLKQKEVGMKKYNLNVFAKLQVELPADCELDVNAIKVNLVSAFVSAKDKVRKKAPKKVSFSTEKKERVYEE